MRINLIKTMITHEFSYEFYFFENVKPYINIKITPLFEDIIPPTQGDHISVGNIFAATAYNTDKSMINKVINEMKDTINGKHNFCEYEEEWGWYECSKDECKVWDLDGLLCTISTEKVYIMLQEWRDFFKENFKENMRYLTF